ncbi:MAG: hypothetical protein ACLGIE_14105 [Alphaproteobacteria bacterium]
MSLWPVAAGLPGVWHLSGFGLAHEPDRGGITMIGESARDCAL